MLGSFSKKALDLFQEAQSESMFLEFSEGSIYDFTTCIRPNGTAYGTAGKCRKGTEGKSQSKPKSETRKMKEDAERIEIEGKLNKAMTQYVKHLAETKHYQKLIAVLKAERRDVGLDLKKEMFG